MSRDLLALSAWASSGSVDAGLTQLEYNVRSRAYDTD
jgi:hypothetical protein